MNKRQAAVLNKYPESIQFMASATFNNLDQRYSNIKTIEQAYNSGFLELRDLETIYSKETPVQYLETWINQLSIYTGLPVETDVVRQLARNFYELAAGLNLAEITLFFRFVCQCRYGEFFGSFSPLRFISFLNEFKASRAKYLSSIVREYISDELIKSKELWEKKNNT